MGLLVIQSKVLPIGWAISKRMTKQLVIDAMKIAIANKRPATDLIFHSDRGLQYASYDFQALLREHQREVNTFPDTL